MWSKTAAYTLNGWGGESLRGERFRLTLWHDGESGIEFYDLKKDPGEFTNLANNPEYAAELKTMRSRLDERRRAAKTDVEAYLKKARPAFDKAKYRKNQERIAERRSAKVEK